MGQIIAHVEPFGLNYVLPAMFVALIVLQIMDSGQIGFAHIAVAPSVSLLILSIDQ